MMHLEARVWNMWTDVRLTELFTLRRTERKKKTQQNAASYQDTALKKKNWLTEWPYRYELLIQVDNHTRYRKNTKIKDW